ncbi:MAG: cytochrome b [Pseudomonadales bacterium]|nr:cytochrome b [Pseudomonadales bacterium]
MPIRLKNNYTHFGLISIILHWLVAISVFSLFIVGVWMVDLGYYDEGYHQAPFIHKSVGMLLFGVLLLRLIWQIANPKPAPLSDKSIEVILGNITHLTLSALVFAVCISGYLIVTAADAGISVFNLFEIPAMITNLEGQEDLAGIWHWYLALTLMLLTALHTTAALKHHLIDKNDTLTRMLGGRGRGTKN